MWTKFQIKPNWYTSIYQHYYIYFECNEHTAYEIFKDQSRVYDHYTLLRSENEYTYKPEIENVNNYQLVDGKEVHVYNREYIEKYLKDNRYLVD